MKKFVLLFCFALVALVSQAQNLATGRKAPALKIASWVGQTPELQGTPCLIEFSLPAGAKATERAEALDRLAAQHGERLRVVVVVRETPPKDSPRRAFFAGVDDAGKTFTAYDVQYVPFAVLIDASWRVVWFGNPSSLPVEEIEKLLK